MITSPTLHSSTDCAMISLSLDFPHEMFSPYEMFLPLKIYCKKLNTSANQRNSIILIVIEDALYHGAKCNPIQLKLHGAYVGFPFLKNTVHIIEATK